MAEQFGAYSKYYDLLYQDKDYLGETNYILCLLRRFSKNVHSVLELGSGTGKHAELLAEQGLRVTGVERSEWMLDSAKQRIQLASGRKLLGSFDVTYGDARSYSDGNLYDAVISLFHVVSYQTSKEDLLGILQTAASHLRPGSVFLFDVWYGPAVVTTPPEMRVKRIEDEEVRVLRIAEPVVTGVENRVDVGYTMIVTNKRDGEVTEFGEVHPMRYYFPLELELAANSVGLDLIHSEAWLTGNSPSTNTWGVVFVAQKN